MKLFKIFTIAILVAFVTLVALPEIAASQNDIEHGPNFVDEDADGYNDNAPDADGDGIPNGQDEDFTAGYGFGKGNRNTHRRGFGPRGFVDEDGDGFNDNAPDLDGDGIPNGQDGDFVPGQGFGKGNGRGRGRGFNDADGDGINDNAPDYDGDGIPNGMDEDYDRGNCPGTGSRRGARSRGKGQGHN